MDIYGISVGLEVARPTMQGNAKASKRGTTTGSTHAFIYISMMQIFKSLPNRISQPVIWQWPLFLLFFLFISPSTLVSFCMNITNENGITGIVHRIPLALFLSYFMACVAYFSGKPWVKTIIYTFSVALLATDTFLHNVFHIYIQPFMVMLIGETNLQEAHDFFGTFVLSRGGLITLLVIAVSIALIIMAERLRSKVGQYILSRHVLLTAVKVFTCAVVLWGGCQMQTYYKILSSDNIDDAPITGDIFPNDSFTRLVYSLSSVSLMHNQIEEAIAATTHDTDKPTIANHADSLDVVFVIGESYIKAHAGIYGYSLNTTPNMIKEQKEHRLFAFTNVVSPIGSTSISMKNMLSVNDLLAKEDWSRYPLFPSLFKKANFKVFFWDNQLNDSTSFYAFTLNSFIYDEAMKRACYDQTNKPLMGYDGALIDDFVKNKQQDGKNNLVMFHLWGQHIDANSRFPHTRQFERFTYKDVPNKAKYLDKDKRQDIANYDNATLYNDYVMGKIFDLYRNTNAVVVYLSDHGEEEYDYRNSKGRKACNKQQIPYMLKYVHCIPFMIWCSDRYQAKHPEIVKEISEALHCPFMIDQVAQVLFHLAGMRSQYYKPSNDLLSPSYRERKRILLNGLCFDDYDIK